MLTGGVAAGAALPLLPAHWTHPIVDSVLLPAHAQTSEDPAPITARFAAQCDSDAPDDQFHSIEFPGGVATPGGSFQVTDHGSNDPRPLSGDNLVVFGDHDDLWMDVRIWDAGNSGCHATVSCPGNANPPNDACDGVMTLDSGSQLLYDVVFGDDNGTPTITIQFLEVTS
ncbi:MAG: hypothetical protein U5R46_06640 [Gammaproteobacteria bacterium]|nr:hypothetical protein [Gammaproteobacteria bacterium]